MRASGSKKANRAQTEDKRIDHANKWILKCTLE